MHRANKGVLYIDEIRMLRMEEQQALLVAMQERELSISGRSERSSGALTKSEPVPTDFILVAAGNRTASRTCIPHLGVQDQGYGYEVYVNTDMKDTERNRRRLIRFIAQEVRNEMKKDTGKSIPHFDKQAISLVLKEAQRRSGRRGKLSPRLREPGGLVRPATLQPRTAQPSTLQARGEGQAIAKPLEQQVADRYLERQLGVLHARKRGQQGQEGERPRSARSGYRALRLTRAWSSQSRPWSPPLREGRVRS